MTALENTLFRIQHGPHAFAAATELGAVLFMLPAYLILIVGPVLAWVLNGKFDKLLGPPPGGKWEAGKGNLFPLYPIFRMRDYALAVLSDRFAQRKFSQPKSFFRDRVSSATPYFCALYWILEVCLWLSFGLFGVSRLALYML